MRARHWIKYLLGALAFTVYPLSATGTSAHLLPRLIENTHLLDLRPETELSDLVRQVRRDGYEMSGGEYQSFHRWYAPRWQNMRLDFMTQLEDGFGLLWGFSTGERGEKYRIEPGVRLGLIFVTSPTPQSAFSISFTTSTNGRLREKPCTADYGEIGGVQPVNCRLAASTLEPSATLKHLWKERPSDRTRISLRFQVSF